MALLKSAIFERRTEQMTDSVYPFMSRFRKVLAVQEGVVNRLEAWVTNHTSTGAHKGEFSPTMQLNPQYEDPVSVSSPQRAFCERLSGHLRGMPTGSGQFASLHKNHENPRTQVGVFFKVEFY
eukprot:ANDGO_08378.mRNA.1 hypothetical protein